MSVRRSVALNICSARSISAVCQPQTRQQPSANRANPLSLPGPPRLRVKRQRGIPTPAHPRAGDAFRNAEPAVSFLMQSNSHVLPVQRSSRIEPTGRDRARLPALVDRLSAPAEWSRWNVSLRLAVALAWPAKPVGSYCNGVASSQ